ncbi:hypothetical protein [uncultured Megamonas sp.]|uniref:hypothetical protein n=1 Tax=uncultured Megamonas sp. TaxID=286140 RepID=UPI00259BE53B|nr:hypothetical protein [uncultured Megamonas sp.]
MYKYEVYIGLSIKNSDKILNNQSIIVDFGQYFDLSAQECLGVYTLDNGQKIYENTIKLTILSETEDIDGKLVKLIKQKKEEYQQESILLTKQKIKAVFI